MGLFSFLQRNKKDNFAEKRRDILLKKGRITDGTIIDSEIDDNGEELVRYHYSIHGVIFESSDLLNEEQKKTPIKYAPGAGVGIRYDPKNHHNSILV